MLKWIKNIFLKKEEKPKQVRNYRIEKIDEKILEEIKNRANSYYDFSNNVINSKNIILELEKINNKKRKLISKDSQIYIFTTKHKTKFEADGDGYRDFLHLFEQNIKRKNYYSFDSLTKNKNVFFFNHSGIKQTISNIKDKVNNGDIVIFIRGGGDTNHFSFDLFDDKYIIKELNVLKEKAWVFTGLGHSNNVFLLDNESDFSFATPSDLALKTAILLNKIWEN